VDKIRTFVAVPVNDQARDAVTSAEDDLRRAGADVKWVEARNIHITLKFLGNVETGQLDQLQAALRSALSGVKPLEITLSGTGTFPSGKKHVRVVWVGITEGKQDLVKVAAAVEEGCAGLGFAREERPFSPHLTIGRVRRESGQLAELAARVSGYQFNPLKVEIDRVNLMRSELSPKGPTYTVLETVALEQS
jgi:2'-5' RNA ligase